MIETRFKDTEIGMIPYNWDVVHISDLAENFTGLTYSPENVKEYGTLVLRSSNIQDGKLCFDDNVFVDMAIPERTRVKKNDILVCVRNGSARLIGKCAIIDRVKGETAFGAFMTILRSKENVNPYFVHYIWQSSLLQKQVKDNLGATINQITNKDIDNFIVASPKDYDEQSRIASALTSIDNLISSLDKLIEKKKNIKQGTMQQLLTGKKRLKGFSEPWVEKRLGEILSLRNGYAFKSETYSPTGNYKIITIANVQNGNLDLSEYNTITNIPTSIQCHQILSKGDILISMTGNIGRVCRVNRSNCLLNQRVGLLDIKTGINSDFVFTALNTTVFENSMRDKGQGAAQANIGKSDIEDYLILMPSSENEQIAIANLFKKLDEDIIHLEKKKNKYIAIKQGMMQQLLTGKIRLV